MRLATGRTLADILSWRFLGLLLVNFAVSTLAGLTFRTIDFSKPLHLHFMAYLVLCHMVLVFILNLVNELDVWVDTTERDIVRLDEDIPLCFWMLRLEDPEYSHEQERSAKHIERLMFKHKNMMHQDLVRHAYSQRKVRVDPLSTGTSSCGSPTTSWARWTSTCPS